MEGRWKEITRLNIERYEQLLRIETEPAKRQLLDRLLTEARAELEFIAELDSPRVSQLSEERIAKLRKKAEQCRAVARAYDQQSTREVFYRLAAGYETIADDLQRSAAGPLSDR